MLFRHHIFVSLSDSLKLPVGVGEELSDTKALMQAVDCGSVASTGKAIVGGFHAYLLILQAYMAAIDDASVIQLN
jgi:uncharacterized membrane protein